MPRDRMFEETVQYLFALQKHGIKLALANSVRLMQLMGDPHRKFRSVHIAGTNGKGSTAAFVASVLQAAGYRVGLYTSPHLVNFTERIRVNGICIPEHRVVELAHRVREAYQQEPPASEGALFSPTFFEVTTTLAFTYFAEEGVDIAVVEAGMGGRLDSTNVIMPLVSVITNIDIEHTEFLGNSLAQIAAEKTGIIKPGVPVATGVVQPEALAVIERTAAEKGAPLYRLSRDFGAEQYPVQHGQAFHYRGIDGFRGDLRIAMLGRHQVDNACLAAAAVECLRTAGVAIPGPALERGLAEALWEGRLELMARKPDLYLDGAHNPASAQKLAAAVRDLMPAYKRLVLVIGVLGDKDYRSMLAELLPLAAHVVVTKPQYARAMEVSALAAEVRALHGSVENAATVAEAIALARASASPDDLILITGSLYVVGDARAFLIPDSGSAAALSGLKG